MRILAILLLCTMSSCWMIRASKVKKMRLTDHEKLPWVTITKSDDPFYFINSSDPVRYNHIHNEIDSIIDGTETAAFLVIRNDSLIYEKYFMGFDKNSILPSNSMAKSFIGTLAFIAISDGKIGSSSDPITKYIPELKKNDARFCNITISHLLDMRSGLDFNEGSYTIDDDAIRIGFRPDLVKHLLKAKIAEDPGHFKYQSINTMLLGLVIERATGKKLQDYLQNKLWHPMGAEHDATWNVDSKKRKHVLTSAAINATARDFAKLGRLYLYNGTRDGRQIIGKEWIAMIANADTMGLYDGYKNKWWNRRVKNEASFVRDRHSYESTKPTDAYNAFGFLEQIIYIHPKKKLIIVRLGRGWPNEQEFVQTIYDLGEKL